MKTNSVTEFLENSSLNFIGESEAWKPATWQITGTSDAGTVICKNTCDGDYTIYSHVFDPVDGLRDKTEIATIHTASQLMDHI